MKNKVVLLISVLLAIFFGYTLTKDEQKIIEEVVSGFENISTTSPSSLEASNQLFDVIKIIDGDTITVRIDNVPEKIRLIGIDTPEIGDLKNPSECLAQEAKEEIEILINDYRIRFEFDETQEKRDKYNRLLGYVYLENGIFLNKIMIEKGLAREYTYQKKYKYSDEFKLSEEKAKFNKVGMWDKSRCPELLPTGE